MIIKRSAIISKTRIGIVGAGNIAIEHIKVIQAIDNIAIAGITSRTISKADVLAKNFGIESVYNNVDQLIEKCDLDGLMILVSPDEIFKVTKKLIPLGIPLFIEKPAGLFPNETKTLFNLAKKYGTKNMVGYNRRYYSIFDKGIKLIDKHGPLLGVSIEGHERFWLIENTNFSKLILKNWIYANSTHTIDLLRFFGGEIKSLSAYSAKLNNINDQFSAGVKFNSGSLGSYVSHWYSPDGWSVKLYGKNITVKFKPLEKGIWTDSNFVDHEIDCDKVDYKYKPGFYNQMKAFIKMIKSGKLESPGVDIKNALKTMELAKKIFNSS